MYKCRLSCVSHQVVARSSVVGLYIVNKFVEVLASLRATTLKCMLPHIL